jgi:hypothetical protein
VNRFVDEITRAGVLLAAECPASAVNVRVRRSGEEIPVTDGPFTETKEVLVGSPLLSSEAERPGVIAEQSDG